MSQKTGDPKRVPPYVAISLIEKLRESLVDNPEEFVPEWQRNSMVLHPEMETIYSIAISHLNLALSHMKLADTLEQRLDRENNGP